MIAVAPIQRIFFLRLGAVSPRAKAKGITSRKYSPSTLGFAKVAYTRKVMDENISLSTQPVL